MNCDDVFSVLTRAPFPTGTAIDDVVEEHLRGCASCRRLAAALEPALELPEEAIGPEESHDLPTYWGALFCHPASDESGLDTQGAEHVSAKSARVERVVSAIAGVPIPSVGLPVHRGLGVARFAAAVLCGLAVAGMWGAWQGIELRQPAPAAGTWRRVWPNRATPPAPAVSRAGEAALGALQLQQVCRAIALVGLRGKGAAGSGAAQEEDRLSTPVGTPPVVPGNTSITAEMGSMAEVACCTRCHRSGGEVSGLTAQARHRVATSCVLCHEGSATAGDEPGR